MCKLCDGTACHVRGSMAILDAMHKELQLSATKDTTDDMFFTVGTVSCIGACGLAPALVIDDKTYGNVTPDEVVGILREMRANAEAE